MGLVDIVSLGLIIITYAALAAVQRDDSHIKMDIIPSALSGKLSGYILQIITLVIGLVAVGFLFYAIFWITVDVFQFGTVTETIYAPYWPAAIFMPIGCLLFVIRIVIQLGQTVGQDDSEEDVPARGTQDSGRVDVGVRNTFNSLADRQGK